MITNTKLFSTHEIALGDEDSEDITQTFYKLICYNFSKI
jgi:hypothetical protein